ncbi:hypothetical protein HYDPIDRAFT_93161 [Hydnomerulius pinastri MD-312]|uniref:Small COPII coat GTPase SAR1 n=1 Tax=Hydnomerulius pinastri MD-312 TaxID=994086 RepID=A0A0C9VXT9_9AGAM|nr:hypothetical protein HYDPIDRAFT_93161 [Hydnomerulius pinastri MD-312]
MFLMNWLRDVLARLRLVYKTAHVPILGLDNVGKKTLVHMLKHDEEDALQPIRKPSTKDIVVGTVKFVTYHFGGFAFRDGMSLFSSCVCVVLICPAERPWRDYVREVNGIVFVVDSADIERFPDAKSELCELFAAEDLSKVPILVLGNKIDVLGAVSEEEIRDQLGLNQTSGKNSKPLSNVRPIEIFMCSAVQRQGYGDGFKWLAQYVCPVLVVIVPDDRDFAPRQGCTEDKRIPSTLAPGIFPPCGGEAPAEHNRLSSDKSIVAATSEVVCDQCGSAEGDE